MKTTLGTQYWKPSIYLVMGTTLVTNQFSDSVMKTSVVKIVLVLNHREKMTIEMHKSYSLLLKFSEITVLNGSNASQLHNSPALPTTFRYPLLHTYYTITSSLHSTPFPPQWILQAQVYKLSIDNLKNSVLLSVLKDFVCPNCMHVCFSLGHEREHPIGGQIADSNDLSPWLSGSNNSIGWNLTAANNSQNNVTS